MACRVGVCIDELLDSVTLVDAFGNQLFALLPQNDLKLPENGVSKNTENLDFTVEDSLEHLAASGKRLVNRGCPNNLGCKYDNLAGIGVHKFVQSLSVNLLRFKDRRVLVNGLSKQLSQGRLHATLEESQPVVDLRCLGQRDFLLESDNLTFFGSEARNDSFIVHDET